MPTIALGRLFEAMKNHPLNNGNARFIEENSNTVITLLNNLTKLVKGTSSVTGLYIQNNDKLLVAANCKAKPAPIGTEEINLCNLHYLKAIRDYLQSGRDEYLDKALYSDKRFESSNLPNLSSLCEKASKLQRKLSEAGDDCFEEKAEENDIPNELLNIFNHINELEALRSDISNNMHDIVVRGQRYVKLSYLLHAIKQEITDLPALNPMLQKFNQQYFIPMVNSINKIFQHDLQFTKSFDIVKNNLQVLRMAQNPFLGIFFNDFEIVEEIQDLSLSGQLYESVFNPPMSPYETADPAYHCEQRIMRHITVKALRNNQGCDYIALSLWPCVFCYNTIMHIGQGNTKTEGMLNNYFNGAGIINLTLFPQENQIEILKNMFPSLAAELDPNQHGMVLIGENQNIEVNVEVN